MKLCLKELNNIETSLKGIVKTPMYDIEKI